MAHSSFQKVLENVIGMNPTPRGSWERIYNDSTSYYGSKPLRAFTIPKTSIVWRQTILPWFKRIFMRPKIKLTVQHFPDPLQITVRWAFPYLRIFEEINADNVYLLPGSSYIDMANYVEDTLNDSYDGLAALPCKDSSGIYFYVGLYKNINSEGGIIDQNGHEILFHLPGSGGGGNAGVSIPLP
jgi:hypothetical protein